MKKPRFARRSRALREKEVLDAAFAAFAENGCFRMTLDDVAQRVGIAKGTLYLHYSSREGLLRAVLARACEQLRERCLCAWKTAPNPAAGFRAVISSLMGMDQGPDTVSPATLSRLQCGLIWRQLAPVRDGLLEQALEPVMNALQQARLIDAGLDPRWVARATLALVRGAAEERVEVSKGAERIATLLLRGLAPEVARRDSGKTRKRARAHQA